MRFSYEATLADVAEPAVRVFARGRTHAINRWRGAAICAAMFAVFAFLGFNAKENVNLSLVCAAAAAWGAGLFLLVYKGMVRRRVAAFVSRELPGGWPRTVVIELAAGWLRSSMGGATTTFSLSALSAVAEDKRYLELSFGERVCVIPLRGFDSTDEKHAFLAALGAPRTA